MPLVTVQDFIDQARSMLLDNGAVKRYSDQQLIDGLNNALLEARRLRPDLFIGAFDAVPQYTVLGSAVAVDQMYRPPLVYYMVGHCQLADDEASEDARASAFMSKFTTSLMALAA